jgi:hypothetical protein
VMVSGSMGSGVAMVGRWAIEEEQLADLYCRRAAGPAWKRRGAESVGEFDADRAELEAKQIEAVKRWPRADLAEDDRATRDPAAVEGELGADRHLAGGSTRVRWGSKEIRRWRGDRGRIRPKTTGWHEIQRRPMGTQAVEQLSRAGMELGLGGVTSASWGKEGRWGMGTGGKERPAAPGSGG